jgi:hypothetical protein
MLYLTYGSLNDVKKSLQAAGALTFSPRDLFPWTPCVKLTFQYTTTCALRMFVRKTVLDREFKACGANGMKEEAQTRRCQPGSRVDSERTKQGM